MENKIELLSLFEIGISSSNQKSNMQLLQLHFEFRLFPHLLKRNHTILIIVDQFDPPQTDTDNIVKLIEP